MSEEVIIKTEDGEFSVEMREPSAFSKLELAMTMPDYSSVGEQDEFTEEQLGWLVKFTAENTELTVNDIADIAKYSEDEFDYLFRSSMNFWMEDGEVLSREEFDFGDEQTFIDKDGSVSNLYE